MTTENPVNKTDGKSRSRIKSLMLTVAYVAFGCGVLVWGARTIYQNEADQARFNSWMAEVDKANPSITRSGMSMKSSFNIVVFSRECRYSCLTPTKKEIKIEATLRTTPISILRQVTFESNGKSVTWPFQDIENGRMIDLKAEFPEAFR
jgi:hypothetical protein